MKTISSIVLGALLLAACNLPGENLPAPTGTPAAAPSPTAPPPPPLPPTPTAATPGCVPPQGDPGPLAPGPLADYPAKALAFLDRGGTREQLDAQLYAAGVENQPIGVVEADFTADGKHDVVISLFDPASSMYPPAGLLGVYVCTGGRFTLAYSLAAGQFEGGPKIWVAQDLNADGAADLLVSTTTCGAHTCFDTMQILVWNGATFENRLAGPTDELPYPAAQVTDADGDGIFTLEVTGSGFGSVGAGPQRAITWIWGYDAASGRWVKTGEVAGPSNFRLHVLHDADAALSRGELDVALVLYSRVTSDPTLEDWLDPAAEQATLGAYARYKTMVVYLLKGQLDLAQAVLTDLLAAFPGETSQHAYAVLAGQVHGAFLAGGADAACAAATAYAADHGAQVLEPLGSIYFGYANPDYTPEEMCP